MTPPPAPPLPALLALLTLALAGCSDGSPLFDPTRGTAYRFDGTYTWTEPLAIDGANRTLEAHPLLGEPAFPLAVEQVVEGTGIGQDPGMTASGAESSIGVTSSGALFVHGLDTLWRSRDNGVSWEAVHEFQTPFAPFLRDTWTTGDPMLHVDPATDRIFVVQMYPDTNCLYFAYSDDDGESWSDDADPAVAPGFGSCALPWDDHPKVATAPLGPDTPPGIATQGYPRLVVVCTNKVVPTPVSPPGAQPIGTWCATSLDGSRTWAYEVQAIPPETGCAGTNGIPVHAPDGTLVVPAGGLGGIQSACKRPPMVAVSSDSGLTWELRRMPGEHIQSGIDPDITFTPDGTAYMVYTAQDARTYVVRSPDLFRTWEGPWLVSPPGSVSDVFGAIVSGDDGRVAVAFLTTASPQEDIGRPIDSNDVRPGTMWHLAIASSVDADADAPTWVVQQVTPREDPVQVGCVWLRGGGGGPQGCRNLLDFIDMTVLADGRFVVAFTDGCVPRNGCTADPQNSNFQSRDTTVAVAVQDRGASLYADQGILPSLGLVAPPLPRPEASAEPAQGGDA